MELSLYWALLVPAKEGLMDMLRRAPDRGSFLLSIENSRQKPGWAAQFENTCGLIRYAPVFYVSGTLENLVVESLSPLSPLPVGIAWGDRIGFGKDPSECLPCQPEDYNTLSRLQISPRSGNTTEQDGWPCFDDTENASIGPNVRLPLFARVDFEAVPISLQPDVVLMRWLA